MTVNFDNDVGDRNNNWYKYSVNYINMKTKRSDIVIMNLVDQI